MKPYDKHNIEMKVIRKLTLESKKNVSANIFSEVKYLCEEICFTSCIFRGSLALGRNKR